MNVNYSNRYKIGDLRNWLVSDIGPSVGVHVVVLHGAHDVDAGVPVGAGSGHGVVDDDVGDWCVKAGGAGWGARSPLGAGHDGDALLCRPRVFEFIWNKR